MPAKKKVSVVSGLQRPDFAKIKKETRNFQREVRYAMYYAQQEMPYKNYKTEVLKYAKTQKLDQTALDELDVFEFLTVAKPCYLRNRGADLEEVWETHLSEYLPILVNKGKEKVKLTKKVKKKDPKPVIGVKERVEMQAQAVSEEFERWIDEWMDNPAKYDPKKYNAHKVMTSADLKPNHVKCFVSFYHHDRQEVIEALDKKDEDLVEAYSYCTKSQLKKLLALYDDIIQAANMIIETGKLNRKVPRKKSVPIEKKIANLKFAKTDKDLAIVSIKPEDIIGAQELWVYNQRTRKLSRYIALDQAGLDVKGTSLLNYTTQSSEKTLRKPKEQLAALKKATKPQLRKFLDQITTIDTQPKGRLNENHLLVRVVK